MAKKKDSNPKGCRLCKFRVAPSKGPNNERPSECGELFTETDYYIRHPDEP